MKRRIFLFCVALWYLNVSADPLAKVYPNPDQGTISSSGKFTPSLPSGGTASDASQTRDQAVEALVKHVQSLKQTGSNTFRIGLVEFDKQQRTISLPANVCLRDQVAEYALVTTKGKRYESILSTEAAPVDLHLAMLLLGGGAAPITGKVHEVDSFPETNAVRIEVSWESNGVPVTVPLARLVCLTHNTPNKESESLPVEKWYYNGSEFDQWGFAAQREGSLVALIRDSSALINNPGADRDSDQIHFPNALILPKLGTPVRMLLRLPPAPSPLLYPGQTPITPLSTNLN